MKRAPPVRVDHRWAEGGFSVKVFDFRRNIEETLGTKEEAVLGAAKALRNPNERMQLRVRSTSAETKVLRSAFGIESK